MTTVEERLNAVIFSLGVSQKKYHTGVTSLVLSYLTDIRDDKLPSWVMINYENTVPQEGNQK